MLFRSADLFRLMSHTDHSQTKKSDLVKKSDLGHFYLLCEHSLSLHVAKWTWRGHVTTLAVVSFNMGKITLVRGSEFRLLFD